MDDADVQRLMSPASRTTRRLPHTLLLMTLAATISLAACSSEAIDTADNSTTTVTSGTPPTEGTGAYGLVSAGPTCPVQRVDEPCPARPVDAEIEAQGADGKTKATTHTDSTGHYTLRLEPGSYMLVAVTGNVFPRCPPVALVVTGEAPAQVDISCDTGIR